MVIWGFLGWFTIALTQLEIPMIVGENPHEDCWVNIPLYPRKMTIPSGKRLHNYRKSPFF
jgi:hypothetical protein